MRILLSHGILFSHKKEENSPFSTTQMDLENIGPSEIGKADEYICHTY